MLNALEEYDKIAIGASVQFFENHRLYELADRIKLVYSADFGAIRPLKHIYIKIFNTNSHKFIEFYEDIYKEREVPHYEDAFSVATLILAAIAAMGAYLSPIIGVEYSEWKKKSKQNKKHFSSQDLEETHYLFNYIIKAYAIRNAYYFKKIDQNEFLQLKNALKNVIFKGDNVSEETKMKIEKIWNEFNNSHHFAINGLINDLNKYAIDEILKPLRVHSLSRYKKLQTCDYIIKGTPIFPGQARGIIKIINSLKDIGKVERGDIGVFKYYIPDMTYALKRCSASLGLPESGGLTGHLAIVSRELGIPCITGVNYRFEDGQTAFVDGMTGEIGLIINKK